MGKSQSTSYPDTITLFVAVGLALVVSIGLCNAVVGVTELPAVVIVALVSAVVGTGSEGVGDAIVFGVIVAVVTAAGIFFIPLAPFWTETWLAFCGGVTTSKLVWGAYAEFIRPTPEFGSSEPTQARAPSEPVEHLRECDVVRVVELHAPDRAFLGTKPIRRPPRVGDVAVIVHEHEPDDPTGDVAVEILDDNGYTVWLADFEKRELEFVKRP